MFSLDLILVLQIGNWCVIRLNEVSTSCNFLGMPMHVGKNKTTVFGFFNDRVRQKFQGWSDKGISKVGKLTIWKSAIQMIPNFWMSLFFLFRELFVRALKLKWMGTGRGMDLIGKEYDKHSGRNFVFIKGEDARGLEF